MIIKSILLCYMPCLSTNSYDDLTQFPAKLPLPFRRTIRRQELRQIVPLAETTIYEMEHRVNFHGASI